MKKRKIKFRAWDKQDNCWYKPIYEAYKGNLHDLLIGMSGDLFADTMKGIEHESLWPDKYDIMQFTGLLDKNGRDIYEGDIVFFKKDEWHPLVLKDHHSVAGNMEVVFADAYGSFGFTNEGEFYEYNCVAEIEVIGNIYENPDLLK